MITSDCLVIGYERSDNSDVASLIIARRAPRNGGLTVINSYYGEEAIVMYEKLVTENPNKKIF